jgi:ATP-dependent helicase YprA (DUF1998 family)
MARLARPASTQRTAVVVTVGQGAASGKVAVAACARPAPAAPATDPDQQDSVCLSGSMSTGDHTGAAVRMARLATEICHRSLVGLGDAGGAFEFGQCRAEAAMSARRRVNRDGGRGRGGGAISSFALELGLVCFATGGVSRPKPYSIIESRQQARSWLPQPHELRAVAWGASGKGGPVR